MLLVFPAVAEAIFGKGGRGMAGGGDGRDVVDVLLRIDERELVRSMDISVPLFLIWSCAKLVICSVSKMPPMDILPRAAQYGLGMFQHLVRDLRP